MTMDSSERNGHPTCNPSIPDSLIPDYEKMRGDAIGDTLYSERWVLKTLIKITQFTDDSWNDEFESELCSLWDMTLEKDVVNFLMGQNIFNILNDAIKLTENTRLIEILVGILGNMCCVEKVRVELLQSTESISLLLSLFERPDPLILIQLVRLLHSIAWDLVKESSLTAAWLESELSNSRLTNYLFFILNSSTNEELLYCVLELLNTLCGLELNDKDFSQYFCSPVMLQGMMESWKELYSSWTPDEDFPSKQLCKAASHWTNILSSFCGYEAGRAMLCHSGAALGSILKDILSRPDDCIDDILISTVAILDTLIDVYFNEVVFRRILHFLNFAIQNTGDATNMETTEDNLEPLLLNYIENYCVSVSTKIDGTSLLDALQHCSENHVLLFWKTVNDKQLEDPGERAI